MATTRRRSSQCKAFVEGVARLISRFGGRCPPDDPARFILDSRYGRLRLHLVEGATGGPGNVMGRFDFPRLASEAMGCNSHTGKWNHHYLPSMTAEEALADVERWLLEIRPTSIEDFFGETSILPEMVAQKVFEERCGTTGMSDPLYALAVGHNFDHDGAAAWFVRHVEIRTVLMFDTNSHIRAALLRESGREVLYALVNHWLDGYRHDPLEYRKKFPLVSDAAALQWSLGRMP